MCAVSPPPHPLRPATIAKRIRPRVPMTARRAPILFPIKSNGDSRRDTRANAAAAPGSVSVKTTVTWYVPPGVELVVAIATALAEEE